MTNAKKTKFYIKIDKSRNLNLTTFGKSVLKDRYIINNEDYQDLFARVASYYADNQKHANQIYNYISTRIFHISICRILIRQ